MIDAGLWIRRGHPSDQAPWAALYRAVAAELEWIGGEPPFEEGRVEVSFRHRCGVRPGGLWVVQRGFADQGELVGWFDLWRTEENWLYLGMGIADDLRGRRLGRSMLTVAHSVASQSGASGIQLHVFEHNERGRRLYFSSGFVDVGVAKDVPRKDGRVFRAQEMVKPCGSLDSKAAPLSQQLDTGETVRLDPAGEF